MRILCTVVLLAAGCKLFGTGVEPPPARDVDVAAKAWFEMPDGNDAVLQGAYTVSAGDEETLRLVAADGADVVVLAEPIRHEYGLKKDSAIYLPGPGDGPLLMLLRADGTGLAAIGWPSPVRPRDVTPPSYEDALKSRALVERLRATETLASAPEGVVW